MIQSLGYVALMEATRSCSSVRTIVSTRAIACAGSLSIQRSSIEAPLRLVGIKLSSVVTASVSISAMRHLFRPSGCRAAEQGAVRTAQMLRVARHQMIDTILDDARGPARLTAWAWTVVCGVIPRLSHAPSAA